MRNFFFVCSFFINALSFGENTTNFVYTNKEKKNLRQILIVLFGTISPMPPKKFGNTHSICMINTELTLSWIVVSLHTKLKVKIKKKNILLSLFFCFFFRMMYNPAKKYFDWSFGSC